ncbi:MAG: adenylosuccinate lyase, partial [Candidatus Methanomethylicota archaeon]
MTWMVWLNPPYRYGSEEMRKIFTREHWLQKMLDVEAALARAHAAVRNIPNEAADYIASKASTKHVPLQKVIEIEKITRHETMAVVKALAEACGPYGGYVHLGATSNDILDTALALQLKEALAIIERDLIELAEIAADKAEKYKDTICLGRTHGVAAIVMPFGFKFAVWADEIKRHLERLQECKK